MRLLAVLLGALAWLAASPASAQDVGTAQVIVLNVFGNDINRRMQEGQTRIRDQMVRTGTESAAELVFLDNSQLVIGARSEVTIDRFVFDPDANATKGSFNIVKGVLRFASAGARLNVVVNTRVATLGIRGTIFDVLATSRATELAVHEGAVEVNSAFGNQVVAAGEVLRITTTAAPVALDGPSEEMQAAIAETFALLGPRGITEENTRQARAPAADQDSTVQQARAEPDEDDEALSRAVAGKDRENLLYLDLTYGRLVIEMRPDLAPAHVERVKDLVREGFYDWLIFYNVAVGFVAETGDPTGTGRGGTGRTIDAEFSNERFVRGTVGMKHAIGDDDSADSQFFILYGRAAHLDGKYTVWGHIIYGMEFADLIKPGQPPRDPDPILQLRVLADIAE